MEKIKRLRRRAGVSLTEMSKKTKLHRIALARAERPGQDVKASTLIRIARVLKVPVCALFDRPGHGRRTKRK
jgi:transcriptional regulator with XRE-family HTH domain